MVRVRSNELSPWAGWLLAAGVIQVAGRAVDLRWHATHPGFETATNQLEAHWLIWLGVAAGLLVAVAGLRVVRDRGLWIIACGSLGYVGLAVWHFIEHAVGRDPEIIHVLLAVVWAAILVGILDVTARAVRQRRPLSDGVDV